MPWVNRNRDRGTEVHVTEADHQVGRRCHDVEDLRSRAEIVDPADELDVIGAPRGVGTNRSGVSTHGLVCLWVIERDRQRHLAHRQGDCCRIIQAGSQTRQVIGKPAQRDPRVIYRDEQRADSLHDLGDPAWPVAPERLGEQVDPHPHAQVELGLAGLDKQVPVPGAADAVCR